MFAKFDLRLHPFPTDKLYDAHITPNFSYDQVNPFDEPLLGTLVLTRPASTPNGTSYRIRADAVAESIESVKPSQVGNSGEVTLTVEGGLFSLANYVLESASSQKIGAIAIRQITETQHAVTFDLKGATPGDYSLVGTFVSGTVAKAPQPLVVTAGGEAKIDVSVVTPDNVRDGTRYEGKLKWTNNGDIDADIPLMGVDLPDGWAFAPTPDGPAIEGDFFRFGGLNDGTEGVPPGASGEHRFYFKPGGATGRQSINGAFIPAKEPILDIPEDDLLDVLDALIGPIVQDVDFFRPVEKGARGDLPPGNTAFGVNDLHAVTKANSVREGIRDLAEKHLPPTLGGDEVKQTFAIVVAPFDFTVGSTVHDRIALSRLYDDHLNINSSQIVTLGGDVTFDDFNEAYESIVGQMGKEDTLIVNVVNRTGRFGVEDGFRPTSAETIQAIRDTLTGMENPGRTIISYAVAHLNFG